MSSPTQLYATLVVVGLLLIGIEVFVPGGIIGVFGAIALIAAVFTGFYAFGPQGGMISAVSIIVFGGLLLMLWLRWFPRTPMGKRLTLRTDGSSFKAASEPTALEGHEGVAQSDLRPAGIAIIDGRRMDVVTEAGFIRNGTRIRVIKVEGSRVIVRDIAPT